MNFAGSRWTMSEASAGIFSPVASILSRRRKNPLREDGRKPHAHTVRIKASASSTPASEAAGISSCKGVITKDRQMAVFRPLVEHRGLEPLTS